MPTPILTLDTVAGSYVEISSGTGGRVVRTGIVEGLPTSGVDSADVLFLASTATGMPAQGSAHPTRPNLILASIGVYGMAADVARVELNYEPFGSTAGTSYVLEMDSAASTYATNLLPGTKVPLVVGFTPTATADSGNAIPPSYVTMTFLRPLSRVIVTQLRTGTLDVAAITAFRANNCKVNNATWLGLPAGSWIVTRAAASASRYTGQYQTRLEATDNAGDLWVGFGIVQNQQTGKFAYEAPAGASTGTPGEISSIKSLPYAYGMSIGNGVLRADPYQAINFTSLFGF